MGSNSWLNHFLVTRGQVFDLWNACTLFLRWLTIISGQLGKMKVPRVHGKSTKTRCFDFLQLSWPPSTWKSTKIRHFDFLQFSWLRVHENPQKSDTLIFFNFHDPGRVHENPQKLDASIFFNFHDPGYMKIHKNQTLRFFSTFMTLGAWKSTKIRCFDFLQLSWPRVHESSQI